MTAAPEPGPVPHPEAPPPPTGTAKVLDWLFRNDGRFFAAMAVIVIAATLIYRM